MAQLQVKSASTEWVDGSYPQGDLGVTNLLDGSDSRDLTDKTCNHTMNTAVRGPDYGRPCANFSITNPMRVARVEVLTRVYAGYGRDPLWSIINLQVFTCYGKSECNECPMENRDSLNDNSAWVHFICNGQLANLIVLTNDIAYHLIACEVQAFGLPNKPLLG